MESQKKEFRPCSLKSWASSWLYTDVVNLSVVLTGASSPWIDSHLVCRENPTSKCVPTNDPTLGVKG